VAERRPREASVALPSNLVAELQNLRDKTSVLGQIGRAAAIYRIDHIFIYKDSPNETHLIRHILNYLETPQYLRKRLFSRMPDLRYVGILPPLRTPHHPLEKRTEGLNIGEYREGVVLKSQNGETRIDIGVDRPLILKGSPPSPGSRVTVEITSIKPLLGKIVDRRKPMKYWGYRVHTSDRLDQLVGDPRFDIKIATSQYGFPYFELENTVKDMWRNSNSFLVAFGSPRRGINEILREKQGEDLFDFNLNTIPNQGTETVRTEEAMISTLAILNLLK
jgi:hypothetical protein